MSTELFVVRGAEDGWLPNLIAGVSVWRLAPDLNVDELFAGRLIEPEVDGPDGLPELVEWDLTGLIPLATAEQQHPDKVEAAKREFLERLAAASALFETPAYARFLDAFTLPGFERVENWFFDPRTERLRVMRWGARPRGSAAKGVMVYGPAALVKRERKRMVAVEAGVGAPVEDEPGRRWWVLGLVAIALVAVVGAVAWLGGNTVPESETETESESESESETETETETESETESESEAESETETESGDAPAPLPIPAVHRRVYFDVGESEVGEAQQPSLEIVRSHLAAHPRLRVLLVEGHADVRGQERDNLQLSQERSLAVMRWLVAHGVARDRLRGSGCSERFHATDASGDDLRASRRVEVYIIEPAPSDGVRRHDGCERVEL